MVATRCHRTGVHAVPPNYRPGCAVCLQTLSAGSQGARLSYVRVHRAGGDARALRFLFAPPVAVVAHFPWRAERRGGLAACGSRPQEYSLFARTEIAAAALLPAGESSRS